jgi:hypothetical protein
VDKYSGCGCCGGCRTITFHDAADWTDIDTGAVIDDQVRINGNAKPNRFLEREAFLVSFRVQGKVTITHETDDYVIDGPNGTITAGGLTRTFAEPLASPDYFVTVYLRFTPTHSWISAEGTNDPSHFPRSAMLVQNRSTAPSAEFTVDADNAILADFEIADSEVIPGEDGGYYYSDTFAKRCFTSPSLGCNYTVIKTLFGTMATSGVECHPINLSYTGFVPEQNPQSNFVGSPRLTLDKYSVRDSDEPSRGAWYDSKPTDSKYNDCIEVTSGCANIEVELMDWAKFNVGTIADPRDGYTLGTYFYPTYLLANNALPLFVTASLDTIFPQETFDEPYPKPIMRATVLCPLTQSIGIDGDGPSGGPHWISFDGSAEASTEFSPNDIVSGFTLSASGSGTIQTRSWPPPFDPFPGAPYQVEDPSGSGDYRWITPSEWSHGDAGASWTFSP